MYDDESDLFSVAECSLQQLTCYQLRPAESRYCSQASGVIGAGGSRGGGEVSACAEEACV